MRVICRGHWWRCRLDISTEYQDWILVATAFILGLMFFLPCICGGMRSKFSKRITRYLYTRLHVFFCVVLYLSLIILSIVVTLLPDWTMDQFLFYCVSCIAWILTHLVKFLTSSAIIFVFWFIYRFSDRLAAAAGLEHVTVIRYGWKDLFNVTKRKHRPVEVFIWKVADLQSGNVMKPNDIFVECHLGYNEPARTRVHNKAGSSCFIKESFQLNLDEDSITPYGDDGDVLTMLVKDQTLVASKVLGKKSLTMREVLGIENSTGRESEEFSWSADCFVELRLQPEGKIWLRISPVEEEDAPLLTDGRRGPFQC